MTTTYGGKYVVRRASDFRVETLPGVVEQRWIIDNGSFR